METIDLLEERITNVTYKLDQLEKRLEESESFFFFSLADERDEYLAKVRAIYPILFELDYILFRIDRHNLHKKFNLLEGIENQVNHYEEVLSKLLHNYHSSEEEALIAQ